MPLKNVSMGKNTPCSVSVHCHKQGFIQDFFTRGELDSMFLNMYSSLCFPLVLLSLFGSGSLNVKSETVFIHIYIY